MSSSVSTSPRSLPIRGHRDVSSDNFHVASGFSGHGFMHALGVGRGLTELILTGDYTTVDLHRMGYQRILDDRPYPEHGIR